jgi:hypothetical protein
VTRTILASSALIPVLALVSGCCDRTWASKWKDDAGLARTEIRALVRPGTPIATAKRLMETKGCTCAETRNQEWASGGPLGGSSVRLLDPTSRPRLRPQHARIGPRPRTQGLAQNPGLKNEASAPLSTRVARKVKVSRQSAEPH